MAEKKAQKEQLEETAIVVQDEYDVSAFADMGGLGLEEVKSSDMVIPRLSILQAMSPAVTDEDSTAKAGEIYNITTSENYGRTMQFVAVGYWVSRTKWFTREIGSDVECVAPTATQGTVYGACATCEFAKWTEDGSGKNIPPFCTDFKNFIMLPVLEGVPVSDSPFVLYSGKRTAIRSINRLLTALKMRKHNGAPLPIFADVWEMKAEGQEGKTGGKYYTPAFKRIRSITAAEVPLMLARYKEFDSIRAAAQDFAVKAADPSDEESDIVEDDGAPLGEPLNI